MFFILSKILAFLIQPLIWICGLLVYSFFTKKEILKKRSFLLGLLGLFFFTNPFLSNQVLNAWEVEGLPNSELKDTFDVAIVLGGYAMDMPLNDRLHCTESAERILNPLELYQQGLVRKILLTGGSGSILYDEVQEADIVYDFLIRMGVNEADILVENQSKNTYQNAINSEKILQEQFPNAKCLLVTSAFHMRRSIACFNKTNIDFIPFSVDFQGHPFKPSPIQILLPSPTSLSQWQFLVKEWIGYIVYKIKGYA